MCIAYQKSCGPASGDQSFLIAASNTRLYNLLTPGNYACARGCSASIFRSDDFQLMVEKIELEVKLFEMRTIIVSSI